MSASSRPRFHFTPERNWINDPNGLIFYQGEYHLFFQHNAFADVPGNIGWGHAVSKDLLRWQELPMAIPFASGVMAFSGSAVIDWQNSSGLGVDGLPPFVLVFTGHIDARRIEDQRLAHSADGRSWTLYANNPVLDISKKDFRDPSVFWHAPSQRWIMTLVLANDYLVQFYASDNLKDWTHLSDFGPVGSREGVWEVPVLIELPIKNTFQTRWILKIDVGAGGVFGGSAGKYFVGHFDGVRFTPDPNTDFEQENWLDFGKDFYAAIPWANMPDARHVWLGWMNNWQYAAQTPTEPWRGAMTICRELMLEQFEDGIKLVQQPVEELESLRGEHWRVGPQTVNGAQLLPFHGESLEIIAVFEPGDASEFGLNLRVGANTRTQVGYSVVQGCMFVDRRASGQTDFSTHFSGRHEGPLLLEHGRLRLRVFVDSCSVEVFGNEGRTVITNLIFPNADCDQLEVFAIGGTAQLVSLEVWRLG